MARIEGTFLGHRYSVRGDNYGGYYGYINYYPVYAGCERLGFKEKKMRDTAAEAEVDAKLMIAEYVNSRLANGQAAVEDGMIDRENFYYSQNEKAHNEYRKRHPNELAINAGEYEEILEEIGGNDYDVFYAGGKK